MLAYLVQAVVDETVLNKHEYVTFFNGSNSDLYCSLMAYVRERTYDTSFGDLVPHILANALCVDIIIVVRYNDGSYVTDRVLCTKRVAENVVIIHKYAKHYDGIRPTRNPVNLQVCRTTDKIGVVNQDDNSDSDIRCTNVNHVKILSMNICGLYDWKLEDGLLGSHFKKHDVILLQETWSNEGEEFHLDGYIFYNFPRKYRCKPSLRNSGGLGVFIRRDIAEGVHIVKSYHDVSVWVRLDKHLLGLVNNLYVANVYIVPENSVYLCHDVFHVLRGDISGFPCNSDVLVVVIITPALVLLIR